MLISGRDGGEKDRGLGGGSVGARCACRGANAHGSGIRVSGQRRPVVDPALTVSSLVDGGFVVAWERTIGSGTALLRVQRFDREGAPVGERIESLGPDVAALDVAAGPQDGIVLTYHQLRTAAPGDARLRSVAFEADGTSLGEHDLSTRGHRVESHALGRLGDGTVVAVWHSFDPETGLFGRRLDALGAPVTDRFGISTAGSEPRLVGDVANGFLTV